MEKGLTPAILGSVVDHRLRGIRARLKRTVANSVREVHVLAEAGRITSFATKLVGLGHHVLDAGFLQDERC